MSLTSVSALSTEVLALPESWTTRGGFRFDPREDRWAIPDTMGVLSFNFGRVRPLCTDELVHSLKKVLLWNLQNHSPVHAKNMFHRFKGFAESVVQGGRFLSVVESHHIINYRGTLSLKNEYFLGSLSGFFQKWRELGYSGITPDAYALLRSMVLKKNRTGWAVLTMDPLAGPFTEIELHAIHRAVNKGFASGGIGNRPFSLVWLFMATGARPVQIADLKIKDLLIRRTPSGSIEYLLQVPRAKQRNMLRRSAFKCRPLIREVGEVLEAWIDQVKQDYAERCGSAMNPEELPIFPAWDRANSPGFEHHSNSHELRDEVMSILSSLEVFSHRTGEELHVTPRRFRYTLGTRAAQEKLGPLVIAEMLDHSDTQSALIYTKATPAIIEQIDEALAKDLAPLAQAFAGRIVQSDDYADRRGDPASLVRRPGGEPGQDGVGRCGRCGACSAPAPIACYTCGNFQAWLDGPHEEVLKGLIEDRRRVMAVTGDERIAAANDSVILAVAHVVEMCLRIRTEQGRAQ